MSSKGKAGVSWKANRQAWNTLPITIQYKILRDLTKRNKTYKEIDEKYNVGKKTSQNIKKNGEQIKLNYKNDGDRKEKKHKHKMPRLEEDEYSEDDEGPPVLYPEVPLTNGQQYRVEPSGASSSKSSLTLKIKIGQKSSPAGQGSKGKVGSSTSVESSEGSSNSGGGELPRSRPKPKDAQPRSAFGKKAVVGWDGFLRSGENLKFVAPVTLFKHAPLVNVWEKYAIVGSTFEAPNPFVRCSRPVNWIVKVIHFAGYKALVEFETLGLGKRYMGWMSYFSTLPKPIGYSDSKNIVLHPPHEVRSEFPDYMARLRDVLMASPPITVSATHGQELRSDIQKSQKYRMGQVLEVMDKTCIHQMRLATVTALVGDRFHVTYVIPPTPSDTGFWFNVHSDLAHPLGWSQTVQHEIFGKIAKFNPLPMDYFPTYPEEVKLSKGQLLEVRHPMRPGIICAASVNLVLKYGYFVAEMQVLDEEVVPTRFTFHITSPYVFPCGFGQSHGIKILTPFGESQDTFTWDDFIRRRNLKKAPLDLLPSRPASKFELGMKLEGIDVIEPSYLGPCTICKISGHLLRIRFDGGKRNPTDVDEEVWVDSESPDIYPIGYAELVGHEFQGRVDLEPTDLLSQGMVENGEPDKKLENGKDNGIED